jgi:HEAT repeat protein
MDWGISRMAAQGLDNLGPLHQADVHALAELVRTGPAPARVLAAKFLGKIGRDARDAVPTLIAALGHSESKVRQAAAMALGRIGPKAWPAASALAKAMSDPDVNVRQAAAAALAEFGPDSLIAVPKLIRALKDPFVHKEAARALARIGKAAVPELVEAVAEGDDYPARLAVIQVLGTMGPEARDAQPILSFLSTNHPYQTIRQAASDALQKIKQKPQT